MPHRTLTVVFTDLQGFTSRASRQSRTATEELLRHMESVLLPLLTSRGGRLVKKIGDGFLLIFESPTDAVLAALALQQTLAQRNDVSPLEQRLHVRVAINTGEVALEGDDVVGEPVNLASRVLSVVEPNGILLTEATFLSMNRVECPAVPAGSRTFKGIPEAVSLYIPIRGGAGEILWVKLRRRLPLVVVLAVIGGCVVARVMFRPTAPPVEPSAEVAAPVEEILAEAVTELVLENAPVEPSADAVPEIAGPDPATVEAIHQHLQSHTDWLAGLTEQLKSTEATLAEWRREIGRARVRVAKADSQVELALKRFAEVRDSHRQQVSSLADRYRQQGDEYSSGYLGADLAQYEAKAAEWESTLQAHHTVLQDAPRLLRELDRMSETWWDDIHPIRQELLRQSYQITPLWSFTTWEPELDRLASDIAAVSARMTALAESFAVSQPEVDLRKQEADAAEQAVAGWVDFQSQWRQYLTAWR